MRIALPTWNGRISPVFDTAGRILLIDYEDDSEVGRCEETLTDPDLRVRAHQFAYWEVEELICGAISRPLAHMLASCGVSVTPFITGSVEEVLEARRDGTLGDPRFIMPGCRGQRRRGRRRCRRGAPS